MKYYTGIGSRSTPEDIGKLMTSYAKRLSIFGYTLRSGGAEGADTYFELGADTTEIYLPWDNFNGRNGTADTPDNAFDIAKQIHPNWQACSNGAKKLHARNIQQVLGKDLSNPSDFVVYWAKEKNGNVQGGTRTAVELARQYNIKTYNLFINDQHKIFKKKLTELYVRHMVSTLRHTLLFFNEGMNSRDEKNIEYLLDKERYNKKELQHIQRFFKKYKDLKNDPRYLPTEIYNLNN